MPSGIATGSDSYGLYAYNGVTVKEDAEVAATGGVANSLGGGVATSYGIYGSQGVTVSGNAKVTATGGSRASGSLKSWGIFSMNGNITISGGTVTAKGGNGGTSSVGIYSNGGDVIVSGGDVIAESYNAVTGNNYGIQTYANAKTISISGGTIKAKGQGTASAAFKTSNPPVTTVVGTVSYKQGAYADDLSSAAWVAAATTPPDYTSKQMWVSTTGGGGGTPPPGPTAATPAVSALSNKTYKQNDTPTSLSVTASVSDGGTLTYKWYKNTSNSTSGASVIGGASTNSYTPSTATIGISYYYVVVTNTKDSLKAEKISNIAKITVKDPNAVLPGNDPTDVGDFVAPNNEIEGNNGNGGIGSKASDFRDPNNLQDGEFVFPSDDGEAADNFNHGIDFADALDRNKYIIEPEEVTYPEDEEQGSYTVKDIWIDLDWEKIQCRDGINLSDFGFISVDGGVKWKAMKVVENEFSLFKVLGKKAVNIKLAQGYNKKTKKATGATFTFPKISARAAKLKLMVNYYTFRDDTYQTAGMWTLTKKGSDVPVENLQITLVSKKKGPRSVKIRTGGTTRYGEFWGTLPKDAEGKTTGLNVRGLLADGKVSKVKYICRVAPVVNVDEGIYIPGSLAATMNVSGVNKAPNAKVDYKKDVIKMSLGSDKRAALFEGTLGQLSANTSEFETVYAGKSNTMKLVDIESGEGKYDMIACHMMLASRKKAVSTPQVIILPATQVLAAETLSPSKGKLSLDKKYEVYSGGKWGSLPSVGSDKEYQIRLKAITGKTPQPASDIGTLKITWGEYDTGKKGITDAQIVVNTAG